MPPSAPYPANAYFVTHRLLIILIVMTAGLTAQQRTNENVLARAELARKTIDLGDQIWLEVNVSAPPGTAVSPLAGEYIDALPGVEVIEAKELNVVAETPELLLQQRYLITSFDTGYISLPPLPYYYRAAGGADTTYTNDLLLKVNAIPVGADDELRPIKPIIEEPLRLIDFWWVGALLALGLIGYLFVYLPGREKTYVPPPPPPPAHTVAQRALDELEARRLWQGGETKAYYSELTRILREYLENRFELPALEMTTRQITTRLGQRTDFDRAQVGELSELLQLSDLVKFAQAQPAEALHPAGLRRVRTFVTTTGARPAEATEEPASVTPPASPTPPAPASAPPAASGEDDAPSTPQNDAR